MIRQAHLLRDAMQLAATTRMGADKFFLWVEKEERRHELADGVPVAIAEGMEAAVVLGEPELALRFADAYESLQFQPRPRLVLDGG